MPSVLEALDELLSASDADSMRWNDGGEHERAAEMLGMLQEAQWQAVSSLVDARPASWRQCLASVLGPHQGNAAAQLLLELTNDSDGEVAFEALSAVAFYCGVNSSADGVFVDMSIQIPAFLSLARTSMSLRQAIQRLSSDGSGPFPFVARFRLLAREIAA
ncbi:hypothetical protein [Roseateles sp. P5_E11]